MVTGISDGQYDLHPLSILEAITCNRMGNNNYTIGKMPTHKGLKCDNSSQTCIYVFVIFTVNNVQIYFCSGAIVTRIEIVIVRVL